MDFSEKDPFSKRPLISNPKENKQTPQRQNQNREGLGEVGTFGPRLILNLPNKNPPKKTNKQKVRARWRGDIVRAASAWQQERRDVLTGGGAPLAPELSLDPTRPGQRREFPTRPRHLSETSEVGIGNPVFFFHTIKVGNGHFLVNSQIIYVCR